MYILGDLKTYNHKVILFRFANFMIIFPLHPCLSVFNCCGKILEKADIKEEKCILGHGFKGFGPCLPGFIVSRL
jgi:hypothetical protein